MKGMPAFLASLAFSTCLFLVVPLQSYLANAGSFPFGWAEFFASVLPSCLLAFAVAFPVLAVAERRLGRLPQLLVLAVAVAVLLETGPLSIGLPQFDGRYSVFKSHSRQCWDLAVWVAVIGLTVWFRKTLSEFVGWISLAVVVYGLATIADVRRDPDAGKNFSAADGYLVERMTSHADVARSVGFSAKRNVLLLIVDSVSSDLAAKMFRDHPEVTSKFEGFVNYENNLGMHWPTRRAIPGLFTGKYLESMKDESSADYIAYCHSYLKCGSLLEPYLAADIPTFMILDMGFGGYTNRPKQSGARKAAGSASGRMTGALAWSVGEISVFRGMPYVLKRHYLRRLTRRWRALNADGWYGSDKKLWRHLSGCPVYADWPCTLQAHHTWGVHVPVCFGRHGEERRASDGGSAALFEDATAFIFEQIGGFLDALREKGVYDSATIVIAADHGVNLRREGVRSNGVPERAFPMLMVKAAGARGAFASSSAPTTHAGIADVIRDSVGRDLPLSEIESRLVRDIRLVRDGGRGKIVDWRISRDGHVERKESCE